MSFEDISNEERTMKKITKEFKQSPKLKRNTVTNNQRKKYLEKRQNIVSDAYERIERKRSAFFNTDHPVRSAKALARS